MRITFVAGGVEPGRDGVGDYTRLLAAECQRLGVDCAVVALADPDSETSTTEQFEGGVRIRRLPARAAWRERWTALAEELAAFRPDWVSLQFVPYAFHRRGMPVRFVRTIPRMIAPARLHIMFHEIWIRPEGSWRATLVSGVQRYCVRRIAAVPNALVYTSNAAYRAQLLQERIDARQEQLFGTIPSQPAEAMGWLGPALTALGCDAGSRRQAWWIAALFGTLHPVWPPEPLMGRLDAAAARVGRRLALVSVGHLGSGEPLWADLCRRYGGRIPMLRLGGQSATRISELLNTVDFGIATTPLSLLGKSGTVAVMLEHGLPVIVNRNDVPPPPAVDDGSEDEDLILPLDDRFDERIAQARRKPHTPRLQASARRLIAALSAASA